MLKALKDKVEARNEVFKKNYPSAAKHFARICGKAMRLYLLLLMLEGALGMHERAASASGR
jgi:hypothetical protein